ncbi:YgfZ/GcvT domain-containing protein [Devosia nitrariae]|uniref:Aminomethyltransferase n=1 Tax=Devosia nitrariae TaxID=2071872 RepID=A0ABQ5W5H3_9HYPH|nr:folate-binding protein [Devosia nitrariae]GLQ54916.1 aminomethyltransferase [Devosia nitrariae]
MATILRAGRAVVRFSGPDAHRLLNDVLTGPFAEGSETAGWWALLSPQGKILAEGLAGFAKGAWWLDVAADVAENFLKRMKMYRLRAKAEIEDLTETHRVGWARDRLEGGIVHRDARGGGLGYRVVATADAAAAWGEGEDFARARIAAGISELGEDFGPETTFAHDIGMDLNDGIDFVKGCYVGQEVVSRMKHRGTARRRPVVVSGIAAPAGSAVVAGGREAGSVGRVVEGHAVAVLRLDRITDSDAVTVEGAPATLRLPDWASYAFGESADAD